MLRILCTSQRPPPVPCDEGQKLDEKDILDIMLNVLFLWKKSHTVTDEGESESERERDDSDKTYYAKFLLLVRA